MKEAHFPSLTSVILGIEDVSVWLLMHVLMSNLALGKRQRQAIK